MKRKRAARLSSSSRRAQRLLDTVHLNAAGIDIGSASHWVAVPADRSPEPVREFRSVTPALWALADWLEACGIETVAMESTGVYWIPLYEELEARGIEVLLVNARHVKSVPGRKSDLNDCQWLQQLHTFGLLRGSFRPAAPIVALRSLVRHRDQLVATAATTIHRMQKALVLMNVQLHTVLSDITGGTGLAIVRDIVAGATDPVGLARHRHPRCKATPAEFRAALTGHYQPEHLFALRQTLALYDVYQAQLQDCDAAIEAQLAALPTPAAPPATPLAPARPRTRSANEPACDLRSPLHRLCGGVDLSALPGLGPYGALKLVAEIGLDMHRWPTAQHFVAWLTVAPRPQISGGKVLRSHTPPSTNRAALILRIAAMSLGRSDHALGAFYRRLAARTGKAKAITATARKLGLLVYRMLRDGVPYREQTAADYDHLQRARILRGLRRRATALGFELVDAQTGVVT